MEIKGFIENSLVEWEGKIASVIFLPGCNLRCRYCHAAHLVFHPERIESIARQQVFDYLRSQRGWVDGVVLSGGEPTLHGEELVDLIREVRAVPLQVMVETNGTRPDCLAGLLEGGLVDALAMDVKAPLDAEDYACVAGVPVDVADVRRSIEIIKQSGLPHEFRITLVPGLVGAAELERIAPELEGARQIALQNFKPDHCLSEELRTVTPYMPDQLEDFELLISWAAQRCVVRGQGHALTARSESR